MNQKKMNRVVLGVVLALTLAAPADAASELNVTNAWLRALPGRLPAAGYFTLRNAASKPVTLSGAYSPSCGMVMLHKSMNMGGVASMDNVSTVAVPAGGSLEFAPGGYHLMCMQPTSTLRRGGKVDVTLQFVGGSTISVQFAVRGANGR